MIGDRRYNIDNVEGSLTLWGELWRLIREIKMRGFQPDLVTSLVYRHGGFSIVRDDVYRGPGPDMVLLHALELCFCCFVIGGDLLIGGKHWLIAQQGFVRGHLDRFIIPLIVYCRCNR